MTPARAVAADSLLKLAATILKNAFIVVVITKTNRKKMLYLRSGRPKRCIRGKLTKTGMPFSEGQPGNKE